jgi:hypothetical protein
MSMAGNGRDRQFFNTVKSEPGFKAAHRDCSKIER